MSSITPTAVAFLEELLGLGGLLLFFVGDRSLLDPDYFCSFNLSFIRIHYSYRLLC